MTDAEDLSDEPCPFCGYRPPNLLHAMVHLGGHVTGRYTTGKQQLEAMD